jgi:hypothetical protein
MIFILVDFRDQRTGSKRTNGHIEKVTRFEDHYSPPVERPRSVRK